MIASRRKAKSMQRTLLLLQIVQFLMVVGLAVVFGLQSAWIGVGVNVFGILAVLIGFIGSYSNGSAVSKAFATMSSMWILLGIVHVGVFTGLIPVLNDKLDGYFVGSTTASTILSDLHPNQFFWYVTPTLYSIGIWFAGMSTVLACLIPSDEELGALDFEDVYSKEDPHWNHDLNAPMPSHYPAPYSEQFGGQTVILQLPAQGYHPNQQRLSYPGAFSTSMYGTATDMPMDDRIRDIRQSSRY